MQQGLANCPEDCGGIDAPHSALDSSQLDVRSLYGCDQDQKWPLYYTTCTACDGTKVRRDTRERCGDCEEAGPLRGMQEVRRCPAHFITSDVATAMRAYVWSQKGILPVPGGMEAQSPVFVEFCAMFAAEISKAQDMQQKE